MSGILQTAMWLSLLGLIPYALPIAMPSWRWLLACTVVVGGGLAVVQIHDVIASHSADYKAGPGGAFGIAFFLVVTLSFAAGVAARVVSLALRAGGWSSSSGAIVHIAGFVLLIGACLTVVHL